MCLTQILLFTLIQVWRVTDGNNPSGGRWKAGEINHINVFDLKARFIGCRHTAREKSYKHVRVIYDNIIVISYVNNKGGIKAEFSNKIAKELWVWCTSQNMWDQLHTFLIHKILRQIFLETSMRLSNGN